MPRARERTAANQLWEEGDTSARCGHGLMETLLPILPSLALEALHCPLLVVVTLVHQTWLLLCSLWTSWAPYCISYQIPRLGGWWMYSREKREKYSRYIDIYIIYLYYQALHFGCIFHRSFFSANMFECLNRCLCLNNDSCVQFKETVFSFEFFCFFFQLQCFKDRSESHSVIWKIISEVTGVQTVSNITTESLWSS